MNDSTPSNYTAVALSLPKRVEVVEVGLRDGLQSVTHTLSVSTKLHIVEELIAAGIRTLEVASFAHPRVLPQLADAEDLCSGLPDSPGVRFRGLVPNVKGARRAAECRLDEIVALVCCDEDIARINQGRGVAEVLDDLAEVVDIAGAAGQDVVAGISMAFFAPGSGPIPHAQRDWVVDHVVGLGVKSLYLADSIGLADPRQVFDAVTRVRTVHPDIRVGVHLHTRNGMAMANTFAAMLAGVHFIESSFGGLGGDLWFPGSVESLGNTPTEDLLVLARDLAVATGVDLDRYRLASTTAEKATGRRSISALVRGGGREEIASLTWQTDMLPSTGRKHP